MRRSEIIVAALSALMLALLLVTGCARISPQEEGLLRIAEASASSLAEHDLPTCPQAEGIHELAGGQARALTALRQSLTERSWIRAFLDGLVGDEQVTP